MIRNPDLRTHGLDLESLNTGQLFGLFDSYVKTKTTAVPYSDLAVAWGLLFSGLDLSADELVNGMEKGEHPLGEERERILREFIWTDCRSGGAVVLAIIKKGGNIDRAGLFMIAEGTDLAGLVHGGTTALHLLAGACDRSLRPALIRRAGKRALGGMFDSRGLPVLFTILTLNDLRKQDLTAIGQVFTRDELAHVKNRNQTGRSVLEVYTEASQRMKGRVPGERNTFSTNRAVKNTKLRPEKPDRRPGSGPQRPGTDVFGESHDDEDEEAQREGIRRGYRDLLSPSSDTIRKMGRRGPGGR